MLVFFHLIYKQLKQSYCVYMCCKYFFFLKKRVQSIVVLKNRTVCVYSRKDEQSFFNHIMFLARFFEEKKLLTLHKKCHNVYKKATHFLTYQKSSCFERIVIK